MRRSLFEMARESDLIHLRSSVTGALTPVRFYFAVRDRFNLPYICPIFPDEDVFWFEPFDGIDGKTLPLAAVTISLAGVVPSTENYVQVATVFNQLQRGERWGLRIVSVCVHEEHELKEHDVPGMANATG